jgi:holo-[acyl-carrier protein] synthase
MIEGIGVDIVAIARIENMIAQYGEHFLHKVFTNGEIEYCRRMPRPALHFAGRWAAKEAFYKALPLVCQKVCGFTSIEIVAGESPKPHMAIVSNELDAVVCNTDITATHLSISHEHDNCIAFVVVERKTA